jgi:hypothetical protein
MISSNPDWLLLVLVHIELLLFTVHLRPCWLLRSLSSSDRIEVERGWLLHLLAQSPITSCVKAHHLERPLPRTSIVRACASAKAVLLTRQTANGGKRHVFSERLTTNSRGREVELENLTINRYLFATNSCNLIKVLTFRPFFFAYRFL